MTGKACGTTTTYPAGCTSAVGYSTTTGVKCDSTTGTPGTLTGTAGEISDVNKLSAYNNEEVGAGQKDVKVLGFDVKASKEGDIGLKSAKLSFVITNGSGSTKLADYVDSVAVWQGSTKIGSAEASDFNKDSTGHYSKTVAFDSSVVRSDKTEKFYVTVDALSNLDSDDINSESMTIGVDNLRFVDGAGVVTTDDSTGELAISGVAISFVSFSSAADTELKLSVSTATPAANISKVSATSDTNDVVLLKGKLKLDGTSDVWLDEMPVYFTTNATNIDAITPTVYLTLGGNEYSESMTATAGTTETITFDNLDYDISAGSTVDFTISADINDIDAGTFDEGKYLKAEITATERANIVAENEEGDQLTDSTEMTGASSGNAQYFYSIAPKVEVVSTSITPNDNGTSAASSATAKMKLKITAEGGTVYLNGDDETTAAKELITLAVDGGNSSSSVGSYTYTTSGTYTTTNSASDNEYYTLQDGDTMYVEIEALVNQAAGTSTAVLVGMKGSAVLFGTDETSDTTRSANSMSWSTLTDLLKTGKVSLKS
jgi:hypothetical protein